MKVFIIVFYYKLKISNKTSIYQLDLTNKSFKNKSYSRQNELQKERRQRSSTRVARVIP